MFPLTATTSHYEEGWKGLGEITHVSKEEFKKWVESSHRKTKPFSEYKGVKSGKPAADAAGAGADARKQKAAHVGENIRAIRAIR